MNDKSVMGGLCPVCRPSAISCQPLAKDTSQKKKIFKNKEEALGTQVSNIDNKSTQFVGSLACPSLEDGFGGSINIGRNSMGTHGELHGEIPHRARLQAHSSWLAGERTGTREVGRAKVIQRALKPYTIYLTALNVLFCVCLAHARQSSSPEAAHGVAFTTDSVKPLKIGDTLPEVLWTTPLQMVKAGQERSTVITLNDYRGKLIILDFWATWCSPCLKMLPKSDSLQRTYTKDVAILPITYQSKKEILPVLKNHNKPALPFIINDTLLKKFFPHFYLPHYVWLGADGKVKAITDHYRLTDASIREMLTEEATPAWSVKEDNVLNFERGQNLLDVFKSGVNLPMLAECILTGHIEGLPGGYEIIPNAPDGHYRIVAVNMPMVKLYALAFGGGERYIGNNSMLLETSGKNELMPTYKGDSIIQWAKKNTYCLEVSVPKADWKEAYVTMQEQLNKFFKNYRVKLEPITRTVIAMKKLADFSNKIVSTNLGKPYSTFSNYGFELKGKSLDLLIAQLNVIYMQHSPYPVVNATGMDEPVDLKIEAKLASLKSLNKALQPYGLQFVEEEQTVQTLVFRDK